MPFAHDVRLVAFSYLIATIGSYTALEVAERLRGATGAKARFWLAGSAATLGGSIWAMHFMGLLALEISLPINYDLGATILSLIIAIAAAAAAAGLQIARSGALSVWRFILAGTVVGFGIAAMRYVGMAALLFPGTVAYRPGLWTLSVLIAIAAAIVALWLSMTLQATWQRAVAALVMATAICGMHYTGMQSTEFLVYMRVSTPAGSPPARLPWRLLPSRSPSSYSRSCWSPLIADCWPLLSTKLRRCVPVTSNWRQHRGR